MNTCLNCGIETDNPKFCGSSCAASTNNKAYPKRKPLQPGQRKLKKRQCIACGELTTNPKFCSRSCAATLNGKLYPKRVSERKCIKCDQPVKSYRHVRCEFHWNEYKDNLWKNKTIGEYRNRESVKNRHPSWTHAHVRLFARSWLKHLTLLPCAKCGYSKHVELAHIKEVSSFPDSAMLAEVNSEQNVIQLCPNCHWEFDNLPRTS